jgi:hypothetical protein
VTKRAALLWTFSISSLFFFVCGAQTVEQYSRFDLTIVLYAFSFVDSFLLKDPSNLFALLVMFPTWVFQPVVSGVPQGSVLAPSVFDIHQ